ncbi:MAG: EAL domain-containing protein [Rhodospirillaceae bacterium]
MLKGKQDALATNRDRFIGFSFALAHLLLETDNSGCILFAAGARCGLVANNVSDLVGRSLFDFCPPEEHALLLILFQRLIKKGKLNPTHIALNSINGHKILALFGACRLPNFPERCFLSFYIRGQASGQTSGKQIPDLDKFLPVLESRLLTANATEISQALSMVLIDGLQDTSSGRKVRELIENYFLSISTEGDSAVKLNDNYYAILHGDEADLEDISHDIDQLLANPDQSEPALSTKMWRVGIDKTELPIEDVARAVAFTLKQFATESPNLRKITNINTAIEGILQSTVSRVSEVRRTLEMKDFRMVFQPVVRLTSGLVHHVEALMRVGDSPSPAKFVAFAEEIGLHSDLDLLVLQTVLDHLHVANDQKRIVPDVALNISAISITSTLFLNQLETILKPYGDITKKLLIDISDISDASGLTRLKEGVAKLRKMGIRCCLDNVSGGGISFMALNELRVDFAKIDGELILLAMKETKSRNILQSIIQICSHLGTVIIAEQVENGEQRNFLRGIGIQLGQGYLFGQPSSDLPVLENRLGKS